jgi:hypothetical protein
LGCLRLSLSGWRLVAHRLLHIVAKGIVIRNDVGLSSGVVSVLIAHVVTDNMTATIGALDLHPVYAVLGALFSRLFRTKVRHHCIMLRHKGAYASWVNG